ncbi:MAG: hypothetical protein V3T72_16630 [Thermoanaerobaculia bacterium]
MRPQLSIMVMRRFKAVTKLAAAIRRPRSGVVEALAEYFGEALPGGKRIFHLLADGLLSELDRLLAVDREKVRADDAAEAARQRFNGTTAELYGQVVSTRDSIVGAFGRAQARKLIQGRVSRNADKLGAQVIPIARFLARQARDDCPEESKADGFEPRFHSERLGSLRETLVKAKIDFQWKETALALSREKWTDAIAEIDDSCRSTIKTAEGLHELVGVDARLGSFRKAIRKRAYEKRQPAEGSRQPGESDSAA